MRAWVRACVRACARACARANVYAGPAKRTQKRLAHTDAPHTGLKSVGAPPPPSPPSIASRARTGDDKVGALGEGVRVCVCTGDDKVGALGKGGDEVLHCQQLHDDAVPEPKAHARHLI